MTAPRARPFLGIPRPLIGVVLRAVERSAPITVHGPSAPVARAWADTAFDPGVVAP